jgi:hypothetical protein
VIYVIAPGMASDGEPTRSFLADLPSEIIAALGEIEGPPVSGLDAGAQLQAVMESCTPYEFNAGVLSVYTDPRWFSTHSGGGVGTPLLVLRRWPGDTAMALYAISGPLEQERPAEPPVSESDFELAAGWSESRADWVGKINTTAGERSAIWVDKRVPGDAKRLGVLLIPGDAGLGASGVADLTVELLSMLDRIVIDGEKWKRLPGLAPGRSVIIPPMGSIPGDRSEKEDPWQVVRGTGFTMGLPPGFRARRLDGGAPPPVEIPGGLLWLRGRFRDMEDVAVVVGDGSRVGYVAAVEPMGKEWSSSSAAPLGAPSSTRAAKQSFPLVAERAGAVSATAERWKEAGFEGEWLLFRLLFEKLGVEIALPVLEGRKSASLFWIPATWRPEGKSPAPPPVDPAERFGISFARLRPSQQARQPWTEGYLSVPGLRAAMPKGWFPAASLRSRNGFPIRFVDDNGRTRGRLQRLDVGDLPPLNDPSSGWQEMEKPAVHRAAGLYSTEQGKRLYVAGDGHAFLFEPEAVDSPDLREKWQLLVDSVQLQRADR